MSKTQEADQKAELILDQLDAFLRKHGWKLYGKSIYLTKSGIKLNVQIKELIET